MDFFGRLSDYEIFGHLTQGFLLLAGSDLVFGTSLIIGATWDVPTGFAVVLLSYVVGHLVASPSSLVLERGLVHRVLGPPLAYLLGNDEQATAKKLLFPGYFDPLPESIRNKLPELIGETGSSPRARSESIFWRIYPIARGDEATRTRLATFLRLYAFCRNSAFVGLVVSTALFFSIAFHGLAISNSIHLDRLGAGLLILTASWILLHRYLKFYRLYSVELITAYARLVNQPPAPRGKKAA